MVATAASSSLTATPPSVRHSSATFGLATSPVSLHRQHPEFSFIGRSEYKKTAETGPIVCTKRRVHFAPTPQTLYFLASRPTNVTVEPLAELVLKPLNCAHLGQGRWLASVSQMREDPFCQLDYLRVGTEADHYSDDMLWPLEDEEDPTLIRSFASAGGASAASEFFLVGEVAAYNLDYKKEVIVHYTMDEWQTKAAVRARYTSSIAVLRIDKFKFTIPVPPPCPSGLEIAIEYQVCSRSHWDSLNGLNYRFSLTLVPLLLSNLDPLLPSAEDERVDTFATENENAGVLLRPMRDLSTCTALTMPIPIEKLKKQTNSLLSSSPAHVAVWSSTAGPFSLSRMPKTLQVTQSPVKSRSQTSYSWDCTKSFTLMAMRASRDRLRSEKRPPQAEAFNSPSLAMPFF